MGTKSLSGVFCAFWTPTDSSGAILWEPFEKHLAWVLDAGVDGVMALGSTAEFPHLTVGQRKEVLEHVVRACKAKSGRKVIANVSHVQHRVAIELGKHARSAGADVIAILPPWFYPLEQRDLAEFFIEVGRQVGGPVELYNYPEVSGKKISIETIRAVAKAIPLAAVKQSGAEYEYHRPLIEAGRELGFAVLTGADTRLEECLKLGCAGSVSGLTNAVPEITTRIYRNFKAGRDSKSETEFMSKIAHELATLPFPLNVNAAIAARGFETGVPKNPISRETAAEYHKLVERFRELFAVL